MANASSQIINPHFFQPLLSDFHSHLNIPMTFFSKHIKGATNEGNAVVKLTSDASDITWEVKINGRRLTQGWQNFATGHDLRVGDIVIFRRDGDLLFHVTSFGPSCCQIQIRTSIIKTQEKQDLPSDNSCFVARVTSLNLSRDMLFLPRGFSRSNGLTNRECEIILLNEYGKPWKLFLSNHKDCLQSSSSTSQDRFLTLTLTQYSLRKSKLCQPGKFLCLNGMENARKITLVDRYGIKRTTSLRPDNNYGTMRMGKEWREFCEANGVKAGESFTLELIKEEEEDTSTHLLKFCTKV